MDSKKFKCSYCQQECDIVIDNGAFDADGPGGTIVGYLPEVEVSSCCGEDVGELQEIEEIDNA